MGCFFLFFLFFFVTCVCLKGAIILIEKVSRLPKAKNKKKKRKKQLKGREEKKGGKKINEERIETKTPDGDIHGKNDCLYLLFDYM